MAHNAFGHFLIARLRGRQIYHVQTTLHGLPLRKGAFPGASAPQNECFHINEF
jgi:hypothetical protein